MASIRAVIYCRCSTEEESQVDALKKQVIEAKACVSENGWELVDEYVESKSGTTSKGREQYTRLLDDILTSKFDIIVIKSQDRLMRNTKDWYLFLDRLQSNGKSLYLYLERKFYSSDDALITGIKAILAEEYSRELSRKIVNAHRHRQKNGGKVMLTNQVYGYRKNPDGSVSVIEEEAAIIHQIFEYCAAGYGSRTIANILQNMGIRSKKGKYMTAATVGRMIKNPMYKGIFVMNRQHFDFATKRTIKNPKDQWIYQEGLIPAIVEEELWDQANAAREKRAQKNHQDGSYPRGSNPGKYSLSGKLVCGTCGKPYYRTWRRSYADPEHIIVEWKCSSYIEYGRVENNRRDSIRKIKHEEENKVRGCDNVHLDEEILFKLLEQLSADYFRLKQEEREGIIQKTIRLLEKALSQNDSGQKLAQLEKAESEIREKKQRLLDKLLDGVISDADYSDKNKKLDEDLLKNTESRSKLQDQNRDQKDLEQRIADIRWKLEHGGLEKATAGQMLKDIRCIVVHEWQVEVQFNPLSIMGIHDAGKNQAVKLLDQTGQEFSVFLDYPYAPSTERGRIQDKAEIIRLLQENPGLTAKNLASQMGRTLGMIRSRMNELKREDYIRFNGKGGHGYWEILKEYSENRKGDIE